MSDSPSDPRAMTPQEIEDAARTDSDAYPLTQEDLRGMPRAPQAKVIRRSLGLTQEEFSDQYQIPLGTLRDWEQGRTEPDQPARAYLKEIARDPQGVRETLRATSGAFRRERGDSRVKDSAGRVLRRSKNK